MSEKYYGAAASERRFVNSLMKIDSCGKEQDWEIEVADSARIDEILDLLREEEMNVDQRSALALLLMASIDEANRHEISITPDQERRIRSEITAVKSVEDRMRFFWVELGQASDVKSMKKFFE